MTARTFDLLVIGAGVAGASAALRAAELGLTIAVVDAGRPGRATTAGAGIVSDHGLGDADQDDAWRALVRAATAEHAPLLAALGDDAARRSRFGRVGEVVLAGTDEEAAALRRLEDRLAASHGVVAQRVTGDDLVDAWPAVRRELQGLHIAGTARVDGNRMTAVLLEAATGLGAVRIDGTARFPGRSGRRVEVEGEALEAGLVVVAAGVWSPALVAPLGAHLPVVADRGQIVHLSTGPEAATAPVLKTFDGPYVLGFPDRVVAGATHEVTAAPDPAVRAGDQLEVLRHAFAVAPGLRTARILETRVGFRPGSPDGFPLVGPIGDGVAALTGFGAWGLTLGPLLGRRLVESLLGASEPGRPDLAALAPYRAAVGGA